MVSDKLKGYLSTLALPVIMGALIWSLQLNVSNANEKLDRLEREKASKETVEVKLQYISQQVEEIKSQQKRDMDDLKRMLQEHSSRNGR